MRCLTISHFLAFAAGIRNLSARSITCRCTHCRCGAYLYYCESVPSCFTRMAAASSPAIVESSVAAPGSPSPVGAAATTRVELSDLTSYWYRSARPERPLPSLHIEEVWREVWFAKGAQQIIMDKDLKRFETLLETTAAWVDAGTWQPETLMEKMACILLFDQVPRNIFRGSPQAYAFDRLAYPLATALHDSPDFKSMPVHLRYTVVICIVHSELVTDQDKVVAFAESLPEDTLGLTFRAIGALPYVGNAIAG